MADFNSTSANSTADLGAVACNLNRNASHLAGLAHLLQMMVADYAGNYGEDVDLPAALTALSGIADRAGRDLLDAAATLEKIDIKTRAGTKPEKNHGSRAAGINDELRACSDGLSSIQEVARAILADGDHISLARAIDCISSEYQSRLATIIEEVGDDHG